MQSCYQSSLSSCPVGLPPSSLHSPQPHFQVFSSGKCTDSTESVHGGSSPLGGCHHPSFSGSPPQPQPALSCRTLLSSPSAGPERGAFISALLPLLGNQRQHMLTQGVHARPGFFSSSHLWASVGCSVGCCSIAGKSCSAANLLPPPPCSWVLGSWVIASGICDTAILPLLPPPVALHVVGLPALLAAQQSCCRRHAPMAWQYAVSLASSVAWSFCHCHRVSVAHWFPCLCHSWSKNEKPFAPNLPLFLLQNSQ